MDPRQLGPDQWDLIGRVMNDLLVVAGLTLNAALAFLLGHAVIPALGGSASSRGLRSIRLVLYPVAAAALVLTVVALTRALISAVDVVRQHYPRFLV